MREIQEEVDHAREKRLLREKGEFLEMCRLKKTAGCFGVYQKNGKFCRLLHVL